MHGTAVLLLSGQDGTERKHHHFFGCYCSLNNFTNSLLIFFLQLTPRLFSILFSSHPRSCERDSLTWDLRPNLRRKQERAGIKTVSQLVWCCTCPCQVHFSIHFSQYDCKPVVCVHFSVHFSFIASSFVEIQVVTPCACARGKVISLYVSSSAHKSPDLEF